MDDTREAVEDFLADKPDAERALEALLELDDERDGWTFDDAPVDSGLFGEVVARGIVEERDDGYVLADPDAVAATLGRTDADDGAGRSSLSPAIDSLVPSVDRRAAVSLAGALAVVLAFRLVSLPAVFRGGDVVFLSNDPYFYRYWLAEMLADGGFVVPDTVTAGEPLMLVTLAAVAATLGGGPDVADQVLAWYPVVAALVTAALLYAVGAWLADDRRVGLAAVVMLAVTPVHAYRTAVGFGDHHAFDYVWVAVSLVALVALARAAPDRRTRPTRRTAWWTGVLGVAVAAQALSWTAGPLLSVPIGVYAVARIVADLLADRDPVPGVAPVVAGLALASAVVAGVHAGVGWQTPKVVLGVGMLAAGSAASLAVGAVARRASISPRTAAGSVLASGGVVAAVAFVASPRVRAEFAQLLLRVGQSDIAEVQSLFNPQQGGLVAPFFFFGFLLFVALPYGAWAAWRGVRGERPAWLAAASYLAVFLALATVQVRFAGQLSLPVAVFAGLGFVHLAAWVDVLDRGPAVLRGNADASGRGRADGRRLADDGGRERSVSIPAPATLAGLFALFLLVAGLGAGLTPLRAGNLTHSDAQYDAAQAMAAYSAERGMDYPANYVFSHWSDNRLYNWFVNGEAESYGYARQQFDAFLESTDGERWYRQLGDRSGFVVTEETAVLPDYPDRTLYAQLQRQNGVGLEHYRMMYRSENGDVKAYAVVPGASLVGTGNPNETVTATVTVRRGGNSFRYVGRARTNASGTFSMRVPYPGTYRVANGTVTVPERAVRNGTTVRVDG